MRNRLLLVIAFLLIAFLITVRYIFKNNSESFKASITKFEASQLESFNKEKELTLSNLQLRNPELYKSFAAYFDEKASIQEKDTTYKLLYLEETIQYRSPVPHYVSCVYNRCLIEKNNLSALKLINSRIAFLKTKYQSTFDMWYSKFKDDKLLKKINIANECSKIFPDLFSVNYDKNIWQDFETFLITYNREVDRIKGENKNVSNEYNQFRFNFLSQLKPGIIDYFNKNLESRKTEILTTNSNTKTFDSKFLGPVQYTLDLVSFNREVFQNVYDDALNEQWKKNSLNTGAMPYSYCYGSNNSCSNLSCSQIEVRTGSSDVVVTIKDSQGKVYRHAYIKANQSFTFDVEDGNYQTYFYSGEGWNPAKFITQTSCGILKGGFVAAEYFSKTPEIMLYSQKMTYELILQENGNLHTEGSSKNEAFE